MSPPKAQTSSPLPLEDTFYNSTTALLFAHNACHELALVAKLIRSEDLNIPAFETVVRRAWTNFPPSQIKHIGNKIFIILFSSVADKVQVMEQGPWAFMQSHLLLKDLPLSIRLADIDFTTSSFWIQAYHLPPKQRTLANAKILADSFGTFIAADIDDTTNDDLNGYLRFKAAFDLTKPLTKGVLLIKGVLYPLWIQFKYERIPSFCPQCGIVGHTRSACSTQHPANSRCYYGRELIAKQRNQKDVLQRLQLIQQGLQAAAAISSTPRTSQAFLPPPNYSNSAHVPTAVIQITDDGPNLFKPPVQLNLPMGLLLELESYATGSRSAYATFRNTNMDVKGIQLPPIPRLDDKAMYEIYDLEWDYIFDRFFKLPRSQIEIHSNPDDYNFQVQELQILMERLDSFPMPELKHEEKLWLDRARHFCRKHLEKWAYPVELGVWDIVLATDFKLKGLMNALFSDARDLQSTLQRQTEDKLIRMVREHSLVGRLKCDSPPNIGLLRAIVHKAWQTSCPLEVIHLVDNFILFVFEDCSEKKKILQMGPWSIKGLLLNLKEWPVDVSFREVAFNTSDFWIQVYGVPHDPITDELAMEVASLLKSFFPTIHEVERFENVPEEWKNLLRIKCSVFVDDPLPSGFTLNISDLAEATISFKYERLPLICYRCGRMGHSRASCMFLFEKIDSVKYGPHMRATQLTHLFGGAATPHGSSSSQIADSGTESITKLDTATTPLQADSNHAGWTPMQLSEAFFILDPRMLPIDHSSSPFGDPNDSTASVSEEILDQLFTPPSPNPELALAQTKKRRREMPRSLQIKTAQAHVKAHLEAYIHELEPSVWDVSDNALWQNDQLLESTYSYIHGTNHSAIIRKWEDQHNLLPASQGILKKINISARMRVTTETHNWRAWKEQQLLSTTSSPTKHSFKTLTVGLPRTHTQDNATVNERLQTPTDVE